MYVVEATTNGGAFYRCSCGDRYLLTGDEFKIVGPGGEPQPYRRRYPSVVGWLAAPELLEKHGAESLREPSTQGGAITVGRAIALVLALVFVLLVAFAFEQLEKTKEWADHSAFLGLQQEIRTKLDSFRSAHGTYPASLEQLQIDYGRTDGADPSMLDCFDYEGSASSYSLTEKTCPFD
jgi:hypothetical protein